MNFLMYLLNLTKKTNFVKKLDIFYFNEYSRRSKIRCLPK